MIEFKGNIFKMGLRACRKKKYSFDLEEKLKSSSIRISKDVIYLNDFYNLLYEKGEKETIENQNLPKYFKSEKFYTMRPFCGVLLYNENGEEKFMFYDGNFSNVAGIDIFGNDLYSNEYGPNGEILYSIDYSNISFACTLFDEDTNSYIDQSSGAISPFRNLSYSVYAAPIIKMMRGFGGNLHSTISAPHSVSWEWIMWMCGDSRTEQEFIDCALEVICGLDLDCNPEGTNGNGSANDPNDKCKNPDENTICSAECSKNKDCKKCCTKQYNACKKRCKDKKGCIHEICDPELRACQEECDIWVP